ncbi:uncharacterized protein LOC119768706 [Culex quinquefasciatus]|uniref:uncharacterized protein LOC119768706 n=1 Tax=Culex quinquefasciatus TaxID=7176 RepID=UPI0018E3A2C3|nr:uncharacterized protein LOC119768706 [Culex quinquefasciatus]
MFPGKLEIYFNSVVKVHDNLHNMFGRLSCEDHLKLAATYATATDISEKNLIFAKLLTTLIPSRGKITKSWKPSLVESQEGFILFAQTSAAVQEVINARKERLHGHNIASRKFHLQPTVMVIGPESKPRFTVVFDNIIYQYKTLIDAIAGVITTTYVLDLEYNADAIPAWTFIQEYLFRINPKKKIQAVDEAARILVNWT